MSVDRVELDDAALLVVDMQVDFITGSLPVPNAAEIIPTVNLWIEIFEDLERPVLYSLDWHPEQTPHFDKWPVHCVAGTDGAQIHPDVIYDPVHQDGVYTILKGLGQDDGYSACSMPSEVFHLNKRGKYVAFPSVRDLLKLQKVKSVVVVGLATEFCVQASVFDLLSYGHAVYVQTGGIAGITDAVSKEILEEMQAAGAVLIDAEGNVATVDSPLGV